MMAFMNPFKVIDSAENKLDILPKFITRIDALAPDSLSKSRMLESFFKYLELHDYRYSNKYTEASKIRRVLEEKINAAIVANQNWQDLGWIEFISKLSSNFPDPISLTTLSVFKAYEDYPSPIPVKFLNDSLSSNNPKVVEATLKILKVRTDSESLDVLLKYRYATLLEKGCREAIAVRKDKIPPSDLQSMGPNRAEKGDVVDFLNTFNGKLNAQSIRVLAYGLSFSKSRTKIKSLSDTILSKNLASNTGFNPMDVHDSFWTEEDFLDALIEIMPLSNHPIPPPCSSGLSVEVEKILLKAVKINFTRTDAIGIKFLAKAQTARSKRICDLLAKHSRSEVRDAPKVAKKTKIVKK